MVATIVLFSSGLASAGEPPTGSAVLLDTFRRMEARLQRNDLGLPFFLESSDEDGRLVVDVYGIFDHSFSTVLDVIRTPANWCDIASLHPNVKACTCRRLSDSWQLTFSIGRGTQQAPEDMHQFTNRYRSVTERQDYADIVLSAEKGPFGTRDHRMRFEAMPLDGRRTFVHVSYTYRCTFPARIAGSIYFGIFGRDKVGFTVMGADGSGVPVYVRGHRGAIERSAVRYYFAIQSFLDTLSFPEESRLTARVGRWYDLTARFRKQLPEVDRKSYLAAKATEHRNNEMFQRRIAASGE